MRRIIGCLISLLFLLSCTDRGATYYDEFERKRDVGLHPVEYPDLLGISMQLLKIDSLILINDFKGDSLIHVFDGKHLRLIRKMVSVGNGPGEFLSPLEIQVTDSNLYVFYRQTSFLYSMPSAKIPEGGKELEKLFQASDGANHLYPLSDAVFISSGFYQKPYALVDRKGDVFKEFGEYPAYWPKEESFPVEVRAMFHQTSFLKQAGGERFLAYSSHTIDLYDDVLNPDGPVLVRSWLMGKYDYNYTDGAMLYTEKGADTERGIVYAAGSRKYIYVVYDQSKEMNEEKGSLICIYDWDGNPVELLQFDKSISCLVIDEKENRGYVIAQHPDDALMYFDL
ncbi:MAG: TolB-like 6-bladed beta-propeller domain-containing protein [Tannerellaceae bacterium]|jgi:hypothetical protein|nr:TolB-like 6-bladed beta-propeller domain-containing protein [Tannerellaceae bacterium]